MELVLIGFLRREEASFETERFEEIGVRQPVALLPISGGKRGTGQMLALVTRQRAPLQDQALSASEGIEGCHFTAT